MNRLENLLHDGPSNCLGSEVIRWSQISATSEILPSCCWVTNNKTSLLAAIARRGWVKSNAAFASQSEPKISGNSPCAMTKPPESYIQIERLMFS